MVPRVLEGNIVVLWNSEESLEDLAEIAEQEVSVNLIDDLYWELLKHLTLRLVINGLILVIDPFVIEVALNLLLQGDLKWHILVKTSDESKKSCQFIALVEV